MEKINFAGGTAHRVWDEELIGKMRVVMYVLSTGDASSMKKRMETFPGPNPSSVMRSDLRILSQQDYVVCEKTDGERYLLVFADGVMPGESLAWLCDRAMNIFVVETKMKKSLFRGTMLDGEIVRRKNEDDGWDFAVFDAFATFGNFCATDTYPERMESAAQVCSPKISGMSELTTQPFRLMVKTMMPASNLQHFCDNIIDTLPHPCDGLIFTPVIGAIISGRHATLFKWKSNSQHHVDFSVRRISSSSSSSSTTMFMKQHQQHQHHQHQQQMLAFCVRDKGWPVQIQEMREDEVLQHLRDNTSHDLFSSTTTAIKKIPTISSSSSSVDEKTLFSKTLIVECRYDVNKRQWIPIHIRRDKDSANSMFTMQQTMKNIEEDIDVDELVAVCSNEPSSSSSFTPCASSHTSSHTSSRKEHPDSFTAKVTLPPMKRNRHE